MYQIERAISKLPFLLNEFFSHLHKKSKLRVFLCGRKPADARFDLRIQVKQFMERRLGCEPFLGEEIEELSIPPKTNRNHLTIEVKEASKSDLIVMFLNSPGTIAEVTAFAKDKSTNKKLIVFNEAKYEHEKSFINLGPLSLISKDHIIYYNTEDETIFEKLIIQLDKVVAQTWFKKYGPKDDLDGPFDFKTFMVLATLYASFPIRYKDLDNIFPLGDKALVDGLKQLFKKKLIKKEEDKYLPRKQMEDLYYIREWITDITRVRSALLNKRLKDINYISDYRLIL